jgi:hypothetical protein
MTGGIREDDEPALESKREREPLSTNVGIREDDDGRWLVSFGLLDLGTVERTAAAGLMPDTSEHMPAGGPQGSNWARAALGRR